MCFALWHVWGSGQFNPRFNLAADPLQDHSFGGAKRTSSTLSAEETSIVFIAG